MPKETNGNKPNKEKKHFMKDFKAELKKVVWPTPKQLANNTLAVIVIVLITAVIVAVLDLTFRTLDTYVIEGTKSMVETQDEVNEIDLNEIIENVVEGNSIEEDTTADGEAEETTDNKNETVEEEKSEDNQEDAENE